MVSLIPGDWPRKCSAGEMQVMLTGMMMQMVGANKIVDCDDQDETLNLFDEDGDGVTTCGGDCHDGLVDVVGDVPTGMSPSCSGTDCLSIIEMGYDRGDGLYWLGPYDKEPKQVYCDMSLHGGGWMMFGDIWSHDDFEGPRFVGQNDLGSIERLFVGCIISDFERYFDVMTMETLTHMILSKRVSKPSRILRHRRTNLGNGAIDGYYLVY